MIENNRQARKLFAKDADQPTFRKSDHVRIKNVMQKQHKKLFHPWSDIVFKIIKINAHCKTALLQEVCEDQRKQPIRLIRAFRFLKRVHRPKDAELDAEENDLTEMKTNVQKLSLENKVEELARAKNENKERKAMNSKNTTSVPAAVPVAGARQNKHPMSLRTRR